MTFDGRTDRAIPVEDTAPEAPATVPPRLRDLPIRERAQTVHPGDERPTVSRFTSRQLAAADEAIENCVGYAGVPLGILPGLVVNGFRYDVPMATEERSVIASAAKAAKHCALTGGVTVDSSDRPYVPAQINYVFPTAAEATGAYRRLCELTVEIDAFANTFGGRMIERGGAPVEVCSVRIRHHRTGSVVMLQLLYDTRDAMGANVATAGAERVAEFLAEVGLPRPNQVICSNERSGWVVSARATWTTDLPDAFFPECVRNDPLALASAKEAERAATADVPNGWLAARLFPDRAATHNKGIMNGVGAVAAATGQDWRAISECASGLAHHHGRNNPLSTFVARMDGGRVAAVRGTTAFMIPCGTVGGATRLPYYRECLEILGDPDARGLAEIMAAVGLVQNFAALRALAGEGIPGSHARLRASASE